MKYLGKIANNKDLVTKEYVDGAVKTYTGTSPIIVSGTAISHANSGVTAASKGDTSNQTPAFGGTFKVPSGTVNATGHLTTFGDHTVTIPSTEATTSDAGLMSASDKTKLNGIETGAQVNTITGVKGNAESSYRTGKVNLTPANIGAAASSHTHNYAGSDSAGGPANSLKGFTSTTTTATAVDSATQNGHVYVNGTSSGTNNIYGQSDGAAFVQAYSGSWIAQIYQDYRTGQIALRGKNNGTWQPWRRVIDDDNYQRYTYAKNLLDIHAEGCIKGSYLNDSGVATVDGFSCISDYIPCKANSSYTAQTYALKSDSNLRVFTYTSNKTQIAMAAKVSAAINTVATATIMTPSNAAYIRVSGYLGEVNGTAYGKNAMLQNAQDASAYEPYLPHPEEAVHAAIADRIPGTVATLNANRHVWFSNSEEATKRNYSDNFKYNPSTNVLTVGSITGDAATVGGHTVAKDVPSNAVFTDTNTHRPIQMNGTQILGDNTTALNLKAGSNVSLSNSSGTVTIAATDTTYSSQAAASGGTAVSLVTTGEKYTWNNKSNLALGTTSSTAYRGDYGNTAYSHATDANRLTTATASGFYKIAATANGHVQSLAAVAKSDITALGIPAQDTTYESKAAASGGTAVSLVTTGEKYTWNNKQNALNAMTASEAETGTATTARSITAKVLSDLINTRINAAIGAAIAASY